MKNFERMMNFFTGRGAFILITTVILLVVAIMHCSSWSDVQEFIPFALAAEFLLALQHLLYDKRDIPIAGIGEYGNMKY